MSVQDQDIPSSPFPGMDPYIEDSLYWRGFHQHLAVEIVGSLNPRITPKYFADIEIHNAVQELIISETPPRAQFDTYHMYPDVTIARNNPQSNVLIATSPMQTVPSIIDAPIERVIERSKPETLRSVRIYLTDSQKLVTAIELLSPANKVGDNLIKYQQKRTRIILSDVHLIEIDLLRGGQRPGPEVNVPPIDTDYIVLTNSDNENIYRVSKIWPVAINEPLPTISVPLMAEDSEVPLDLGTIVNKIYQDTYYSLRVDYTQPVPAPKLRPEMAEWWQNQSAAHHAKTNRLRATPSSDV